MSMVRKFLETLNEEELKGVEHYLETNKRLVSESTREENVSDIMFNMMWYYKVQSEYVGKEKALEMLKRKRELYETWKKLGIYS